MSDDKNNFFLNAYKKNLDKSQNKNQAPSGNKTGTKGETSRPGEAKKFVFKKLERDHGPGFEKSHEVKPQPVTLSKRKLSALFLILAGIEKAAGIVKSFQKEELYKVIYEIIKISGITPLEFLEVEKNFGKMGITDLTRHTGGKEYARKLLQAVFGLAEGSEVFIDIIANSDKEALSFIEALSLPQVNKILNDESDMIIAIILSMIAPEKAAKIITSFPADKRSGVIKKMSTKLEINSDALSLIIGKLKEKAKQIIGENTIEISGKERLLNILKKSDSEDSKELIDKIAEDDRDLADELRDNIFTFEDVIHIPRKDFESALVDYDDRDLAFILKGAPEAIKTIFFTCITKKRREILEKEIEYLGKVRKTDVAKERRRFIKYLTVLEEKGEIRLYPDKDIYVE